MSRAGAGDACVASIARSLMDALERRSKLWFRRFEPCSRQLQPRRSRLELARGRIKPSLPLFEPCSGRFKLSCAKLRAAFKRVNQDADLEGKALIPKDSTARLSFFATRAPQWVERADEIGLTEASAQAIEEAVTAARDARAAASLAAEAAKGATARANLADETLTRLGAVAIRTIKAFAVGQQSETTENNVYVAASIEPPQRPGPKRRTQGERNAAVPRVAQVWATPDAQGQVHLRWITHRGGVGGTMGAGAGMMYKVARQVDDAAAVVIGLVGGPGPGRTSNTFTDDAVPVGARTLAYSVTPMQHGGTGTSASVGVVFGMVQAA